MKEFLDLDTGGVGLDRVVELARRHIGLDVAFVAELSGGSHVYRAVAGDAASFCIVSGARTAADDTYCLRLVAGEIQNVIRDAAADVRVAELPLTRSARIGSYIGVPLRLSDGTVWGTLCGLGHAPDPTLDEHSVRLLSMLGELLVRDLDRQRAHELLRAELLALIESESVELAYQPIVDLRGDRCLGIEALARFPAPFHPPHQTFAAAGAVGLGLELERLVISQAWKLLPRLGVGQFLALNVSPDALLELARRANLRRELPLAQLVVEVTEHSVIESYAALQAQLEPLRERGLRIAVDDAGAGYASLRHVVSLRPDFIKVDRSLIHGIAADHGRRVAAEALVSLGRDLASTVIAEGVERPPDLAAVRDLGIDAAQGYLLSKPTSDQNALAEFIGAQPRDNVARFWPANRSRRGYQPTVSRA